MTLNAYLKTGFRCVKPCNVVECLGHFNDIVPSLACILDVFSWNNVVSTVEIPLENPWKWHFQGSKFENVPRCLSSKKLVPLLLVTLVFYHILATSSLKKGVEVSLGNGGVYLNNRGPVILTIPTDQIYSWLITVSVTYSICSFFFRFKFPVWSPLNTKKKHSKNWANPQQN